MIPPEPPAVETPAARHVMPVFWDYKDIALFLVLSFTSLLAAQFLMIVPPLRYLPTPFKLFGAQMVWYILSFGNMYLILLTRYGQAFWRALGWKLPPIRQALGSLLAGPMLAVGLGVIGTLLRTPQLQLPFQQLLEGAGIIVLFAMLVVVIGPVCEELAFRGFFLPKLAQSFGPVAGILVTGLLFGLLHGLEYPDWRYVLLISLAGILFGWTRYRTGSTITSALMHGAFNATQFAGLLAAQMQQQNGAPPYNGG